MKERLNQILDMEKLSPSKFADLIGVQRSSVSHILSGRNNPSYDFLQKTLKTFPGLKADWLMLGEGVMYAQMGRSEGELFSGEFSDQGGMNQNPDEVYHDESLPDEAIKEDVDEDHLAESRGHPGTDTDHLLHSEGNMDKPESPVSLHKQVVQVMVFFDDDTFTSYKPSK